MRAFEHELVVAVANHVALEEEVVARFESVFIAPHVVGGGYVVVVTACGEHAAQGQAENGCRHEGLDEMLTHIEIDINKGFRF